jgi:hypothetical protein
VKSAIEAGLNTAIEDRKRFAQWHQTAVAPETVEDWADHHVMKAWGVKAATRTIHIVLTGADVRLKPFERGRPSQRTVEILGTVRGMNSGKPTLYSTSQALAWLARDRRDHQERLEWMLKIPDLMEKLEGSI